MAEIRKNKVNGKKEYQRLNTDRKKQILAVLMMLVAVFLLIAIFSYSQLDEQYTEVSIIDILKLPFDEGLRTNAAQITNALGLIGAIISNNLINGTVGYAVVIIPVMLLVWGWVVLRNQDWMNVLKLTSYALIIAILFSATMGVTNQIFQSLDKEWSGLVGAFLGDILTKLIGKAGAALIVFAALLIILVLAVDLDIHKSIDRIKSTFDRILNWFSGKKVKHNIVDIVTEENEETEEIEETVIHKTKKEIIFNVPEEEEEPKEEQDEKPRVVKITPKPISKTDSEEEENIDYIFPSVELLDVSKQTEIINDEELKANGEQLRAKLANFGIDLESVSVTPGPVVTLYELVPASDVKISRIVSLENDLALALSAKGIRIIAPIPGKGTIGVEIPNRNPSIVNIRSVINSSKFRESQAVLPLAMGKTISGEIFTDDLSKMPHLLIAGATGSGKSIGINSIIISLLYKLHPSDVKFIIIDPKKIELTPYKKLINHFLAVSSDFREDIVTSTENAVSILKSVEVEMEKRYDKLSKAGVRNIGDYNERIKQGRLTSTPEIKHSKMPYLVVIIDELADLMITTAREIEGPIARLAQMARSVGIHLVFATQRPSVDVITGVIKANFPARIAFQVASKTDSRTILDMNGADQLLGTGDMLYLPSGSPKPIRIQNVYISIDEVEAVVDHIAKQKGYSKPFKLPSIIEKRKNGTSASADDRDELFEEAACLVVRHQQGSVSLIQRRLKVGYSRAARMIDELEAAGIVGPFDGSKAREVLVENEEELLGILRTLG